MDEILLEGHIGITKELLKYMSPEKKFYYGSDESSSINLVKVGTAYFSKLFEFRSVKLKFVVSDAAGADRGFHISCVKTDGALRENQGTDFGESGSGLQLSAIPRVRFRFASHTVRRMSAEFETRRWHALWYVLFWYVWSEYFRYLSGTLPVFDQNISDIWSEYFWYMIKTLPIFDQNISDIWLEYFWYLIRILLVFDRNTFDIWSEHFRCSIRTHPVINHNTTGIWLNAAGIPSEIYRYLIKILPGFWLELLKYLIKYFQCLIRTFLVIDQNSGVLLEYV